MEPLDWRDQRIDTILRQTGQTVDELCLLLPRELLRLCGERIVAYRLVERSSSKDKPAMMIDAALSEIAEFALPFDDDKMRDSFVRSMTGHIRDFVDFERAYRLRTKAGGSRPKELATRDGYGTRIWHAMCDNGWTLREMARKSDSELRQLPNMGPRTIARLRKLAP